MEHMYFIDVFPELVFVNWTLQWTFRNAVYITQVVNLVILVIHFFEIKIFSKNDRGVVVKSIVSKKDVVHFHYIFKFKHTQKEGYCAIESGHMTWALLHFFLL